MKKFVKVSRSFLSLYFIITLTFVVASWLLDEVWRTYLEQDIESYTGYKTMLQAVEDYMLSHPELEWEEVIKGTAKRYGIPLKLESISNIHDTKDREGSQILREGNTHVYYDDDEVELHHLIRNTDTVITLGPTIMPTRPRVEAFARVLLLLVLAFIILIWLWPISRDLDKLKKAASEFGKGDFSVQVPQAKSIMMSELVAGFNAMTLRIKRLIDSHKELTNAVSHELRTPLARSKFALEMLSNIEDKQKQHKYLSQINADIFELESLVNELLVYAALDSDKPALNFEKCNINALVQKQVGLVEELSANFEVKMPEKTVYAICDSHFIERALSNFLTNAIKYGKGEVSVTLSVEDNYCQIAVDDNGEGVADSFKETVFEAFTRGEQSRNKETGGFGLGLAIVKRILEWHQGHVSVKESVLCGACFTMRWPVKF